MELRQCDSVWVQDAVLGVIADGKYRTGDLGGKAKTSEFTRAIIDKMD